MNVEKKRANNIESSRKAKNIFIFNLIKSHIETIYLKDFLFEVNNRFHWKVSKAIV